jgi:peroxisome-assembly ATPase
MILLVFLTLLIGHDEHFAYKRALSRLLEMTSDAYIRENNWTPLPSKERQWESALSSPTITYSSATRDVSAFPENDDFAAEASYNDPVSLSRRPAAPKIRPDHIWGVRDDWGQRAKAWGRGVNTVFTDQNHRSEQ